MNNKLYILLNMYSEPTRLKILIALHQKECSVGELVKYVESSQPNISKHLKVLYKNQMVEKKQCGKYMYYKLDENFLKECFLFEQLMDVFEQHPDGIAVIRKIKSE